MDFIDNTIKLEGGFVDNPADRGGPTNLGITLVTLSQFLGRKASVEELKSITPEFAHSIYEELYLNKPGINQIEDEKLRAVVFDAAVNHGPRPAIQMLQRAIGVSPDGLLGPETLDKAKSLGTPVPFHFLRERTLAYASLVQSDARQAVFLKGWLARVFAQIDSLIT